MSFTLPLRLIISGLFLGLTGLGLHAQQSPLVIEPESFDFYELAPSLEVLEDSLGTLELKDITFSDGFVALEDFGDKFEMEKAYWFRFNIVNMDSSQQTWLIYFHRNDYVDVYDFKAQQGINHQRTGYLVPESEKRILTGAYYAPVILPYGVEKSIYFRITQKIHKHDFGVFQLESPFYAMEYHSSKNSSHMLFQGFLWIMILYNLLIFIHFRDKAGLYYAFYLCTISLFYLFTEGTFRETILSETPLYSAYFINILLLTPAFYYLFIREFLETPKTVPFWDRVLYWMGLVSFLLFVICSMIFLTTYNFPVIEQVVRFSIMIVTVLVFVSCIAIFRSGHILVNYFVWGTMLLALGGIVDTVIWDTGRQWGDFARIGFIAEILLFALGLGKRMKLVEVDKQVAQQNLIDELRKNESLVESQKEELEREVLGRTKELEEQNMQLALAKAEAEQAAQAKSDFLSVMSHEIRTPMNSIIGMTHLLLDDNPQPRQMENLKSLRFSANSLIQLINEILDLNKIESGKIEIEYTEFDFHDLMKQLQHMFRSRANEKGIKLNVQMDPNIERFLIGDPARLSQVLNNLVGNAIKFTNEGKVEIRVSIKKKIKTNMELFFEIEDTGVGIAENKLENIFENFTQAASSTTRKYGGTGLGLAISKKLLELLGGSIDVQSELGRGSVFSFSLKFRKVMDPDKLAKITNEALEYSPLEGLKVLAVDDNIMNRLVLEQFLKKWSVEFDSVESGKLALEKLAEKDYHVILLDIQMPEMDGYEVAKRIREMEGEKKEVPIIALSADIYSNVYDRIVDSGMDDFVSKPFKPEELYAILKNYYSLVASE